MSFKFTFPEFPYTTKDVADIINNPILGRNNLRKLLRNEGVFQGDSPAEEYLQLRYFGYDTVYLANRKFHNRIMVSESGLKFIEELVKEKLNPAKSA